MRVKPRKIPWVSHAVSGKKGYVTVLVPIQVVSEANRSCHWAVRRKRLVEQQTGMTAAFAGLKRPEFPLLISMERLYVASGGKTNGKMDDDNLCERSKASATGLRRGSKLTMPTHASHGTAVKAKAIKSA